MNKPYAHFLILFVVFMAVIGLLSWMNPQESVHKVYIILTGSLMTSGFLTITYHTQKIRSLLKQNIFWLYFSITFIVGSFWYFEFQPGIFDYDLLVLLDSIKRGQITFWLSWQYSYLVYFFFELMGSLNFIGLFSVSIFSFLIALFASNSFPRERKLKIVHSILFMLVIFNPAIMSLVLSFNRDIISTYIILYFAFLSVHFLREWSGYQRRGLLLIFFITMSLSVLIRSEGIIIILIVLLRFLLKRYSSLRLNLGLIFSLLFIILINDRFIGESQNTLDNKKIKIVASLSNPVGYILKHRPEEKEKIKRWLTIYPYHEFVGNYVVTDIPMFHKYGAGSSINQDVLIKEGIQLIGTNPDLYLANRFELLGEKMSSRASGVVVNDSLRECRTRECRIIKNRLSLVPHKPGPLVKGFIRIYDNTIARIFVNLWIPWLILMVSLLSFKISTTISFVSLFILAKFPIMFAMAPAAYFKYYSEIYLGGFLILFLWIGHWNNAKQRES